MTKLKNSYCDKIQKLKLLPNSKTQTVTKVKNSILNNSGTQIVTKLKNSNWDKTKKTQIVTQLIYSNCEETQKEHSFELHKTQANV